MPTRVCQTCRERRPAGSFSSRQAKRCDTCKASPPPRRRLEKPRACYHCHEVKPADAFAWSDGKHGQGLARCRLRVCRDCHAREAAEREQRRAAWRATWTTRSGRAMRRCSDCGLAKDLERGFHANGRGGRMYRCKPCQVAYVRRAELRRREESPESWAHRQRQRAEYTRRDRAENPERWAEYDRRFRERLKADTRRHAAKLETDRIARRLRAERDQGMAVGAPARQRPLGPVPADVLPKIPAAPLAAALHAYAQRCGLSMEIVCERAGIRPRQVHAWLIGQWATVQFDVADRVLTRLGLSWFEVWTEDDPGGHEQAARAFEGLGVAA